MDAPAAANSIELRIAEISQLFDSLDPFPFREKDLDKEAEEFIVSWARELPVDRPLKIVVHLPQAQASTPEAHELGAALTRYFDYRARGIELDLKSGNPAVLFDVALRLLDVAIGCRTPGRLAQKEIELRYALAKPAGRTQPKYGRPVAVCYSDGSHWSEQHVARLAEVEQAWCETEMILRDPAPRAVEGR
jgi:hypothetical protein